MRNFLPSLLMLAALCCALPACGGLDDTVNFDSQKDALAQTGGAATSPAKAEAVASLFVKGNPPTLSMTATATANLAAIQDEVNASVAAVCAGAQVTLDATNLIVTVDFGDSCTLPDVGPVSGTVSAQLEPSSDAIGVAFTFTALTVEGYQLDGTWSVSTSDAVNFTIDCDLSSSGVEVTLSGAVVTLDGDYLGVTLDGPGTITGPIVGEVDIQFSGVHHGFSECYADLGTISMTKNVLTLGGRSVSTTESITFSAATAESGSVDIAVGSITGTVSLPSYSGCGG